MSPGRPLHLIRRFFDTLRARRPDPKGQRFVAGYLDGPMLGVFFAQQAIDQAHAIEVARRVLDVSPDRTDLITAALLHDIGKRHSRLGIIGRTLASILAIVRLPRPRRMASYLDHGRIGADELAAFGESGIVTAFAAGHHGPAPDGVDAGDWGILRSADGE